MMHRTEKRKLRSEVALRREQFLTQMRHKADVAICSGLTNLPELAGKDIAAFVSDGSEPDFKSFLKEWIVAGQRIVLPRSNPKTFSGYEMVLTKDFATELKIGAYGIPEPIKQLPAIEPDEYDRYVWLIPGVAFDVTGARLGRGKGVYDRLLGNTNTMVIGIFYEYQKFESIPVEAHDRQLDLAITEAAVYRYD
jgi:5-formyltetrahydrofolate cyclo-ligase